MQTEGKIKKNTRIDIKSASNEDLGVRTRTQFDWFLIGFFFPKF